MAQQNPFGKAPVRKKGATTAKKSTVNAGRKSNKMMGTAGRVSGKGQKGLRTGQGARAMKASRRGK